MNKKTHIQPLIKFKAGMILHAGDLNNVHDALAQIARQANVHLKTRSPWISGAVLSADSLNNLLKDVEQVSDGLGFDKIKWSFSKFKDGTVLKAEHLNEVVDKIQQLLNNLEDQA